VTPPLLIEITANKLSGLWSALTHESFSVHHGVEDDDMNLLCLGVVGFAPAEEIIQIYLVARYKKSKQFEKRLAKVAALECKEQIK